MKKIKVWLVEYFNENNNCWEWGNIIRQSEATEKQARIETMADSFGCGYNKEKEEIEGDVDDIKYVKDNWEDKTRAWGLEI